MTVNGAITSSSDVSLAALKDIVAQNITSSDGKVGLISGTGNVTDNSAILSSDDVYLGAAEDVATQNITSTDGTVLLASNQGNVTVGGEIDAGSSVVISAQQNITTGTIYSFADGSSGEAITLETTQGTVTTTGDIVTDGADIYISSAGDVASQNFISSGGAITVTSSQGSLVTGYLRSDDGNGNGGKIYLSAGGTIKVTGYFSLNGNNYSIYTSTGNKGWITILPQGSAVKLNKYNAPFLIGDTTTSGSKYQIEIDAPIYKPTPYKPVQAPKPAEPGPEEFLLPLIIEEIFRHGLDAGSTAPVYVDEINPITGRQYLNQQEYQFIKHDLTPSQDAAVKDIVDGDFYNIDLQYVEANGRFGKDVTEGNRRCFGIPLTEYLGGDAYHDQYATDVTGSKGDFIVIPVGPITTIATTNHPATTYFYAAYDGIVLASPPAPKTPLALQIQPPGTSQNIGDLAEVKTVRTKTHFLQRIEAGDALPASVIDGKKYPSDMTRYDKLVNQVLKEALIARACKKPFFIAFDSKAVADTARTLLNSDPAITEEGLTITVQYIPSSPLKPSNNS